MLEGFGKLLFLQWADFGGSAIGNMLQQWEQAGIFNYMLPFLLIFALVFLILIRINLFGENKGIAGIIALVVGLMALRFDFVPVFFSEIFPRMGVGLVIILLVLIFAGIFMDPNEGVFMWILLGIGAIVAAVVLIQTAGSLGWSAGYWWYDNWEMIAGVVFILVLVGIIVGGGSKDKPSKPYKSLIFHDSSK